jgi:signal peptidase I
MAGQDQMAAPSREPLRRSPVGAAFLSLLLPGLGQLYVGLPRRAAGLFAAEFAVDVVFLFWWYGWLPRVWVLAVILLAGFFLYVFAVVDAAIKAARTGLFFPHSYNRWYVYVGLLIAAAIVSTALDAAVGAIAGASGYYQMPSASMAPTIRPGETLMVDTRYFRSHQPARGDVVAYRLPNQPDVTFIKRIVALGGDRIEVSGGHVIVNGKAVEESYVDVGDPAAPLNNMPATTVPDGTVFLIGDNRSNSADSRQMETHGPIPVGNLIGRATELVVPSDMSRIGKWIGTPKE